MQLSTKACPGESTAGKHKTGEINSAAEIGRNKINTEELATFQKTLVRGINGQKEDITSLSFPQPTSKGAMTVAYIATALLVVGPRRKVPRYDYDDMQKIETQIAK